MSSVIGWTASVLGSITRQIANTPFQAYGYFVSGSQSTTQMAQECIQQNTMPLPHCLDDKKIRKINPGSYERILNYNGKTRITEDELIEQLRANPGYEKIAIAGLPITDKALEWIAITSPGVEFLNISLCVHITSAGINALAQACTKIQDLKCSQLAIDDGELNPLLAANPDLRHFTAKNSKFIGENTLKQLAQSNQNLVACMFSMPHLLGQNLDDAFVLFTQNCRNLKILDLFSWGSSCLTDRALVAIAENLHELRFLNVGNGLNYTPASFTTLLTSLPNLRHFKGITSYPGFQFTCEEFLQIIEAVPQIETLELSGLVHIDQDSLQQITRCTKLSSLGMVFATQMTDTLLSEIINQLTKLNKVTIGGTALSGDFLTQIKNSNVQQICLSSVKLNAETNYESGLYADLDLKVLKLTQVTMNEIAVSNMIELLQANPNLKKLQLFTSPATYTQNFFETSRMAKLRKLILQPYDCDNPIDETTMAKFIQQNPKLTCVRILGGTSTGNILTSALATLKQLTTLAVKLATSTSNLDTMQFEHLKFAEFINMPDNAGEQFRLFMQKNNVITLTITNSKLTSNELVAAIEANPTQTSLMYSECSIDDTAMNEILKISLSLIFIQFIWCRHITNDGVQQAQENYPSVTINYSA